MKLSLEQVRHVAALARLALSPAEEERYARQLSEVLDYVAALADLDTSRIAPTAHAAESPPCWREDLVQGSLPADEAVANAAQRSGTAVVVPKIIE
jgi:aspartyl-tRNA(Asn)/glutamyl-tRNA(Gln) amidotransferase subunit C